MNLSFAGCGFLGIYHVGVASCIKEYAPHLTKGKISGASAGALAAACLLTDVCLGECTTFVLQIATKARSRALGPFHPSFNVAQILQDGMEGIFPPDAHKICSGRLHISLTRVTDRKNIVVSQYESREDLIQALMCSAFVPFYSGVIPPMYRGTRYFDGGFSDNIPCLNESTITVSPFAGESDICPRDTSASFLYLNLANTSIQCSTRNLYRMTRILFPPHPEILCQMCRQGFDDTLYFLQRNKLISCVNHLSVTSSIHQEPIITAKDDPVDIDVVDPTLDAGSDGNDSENEECKMVGDGCRECKKRQQVALLDSLPPMVLTKLQDACARNSLLAHVYNHRLYRILALMMSPTVLPVDILVYCTRRFWSWLPHMKTDAQWVMSELPYIIQYILEYLYKRRQSYSARITCQLNITELEFNQERKTQLQSIVNQSKLRNISVDFSLDFQGQVESPVACVHQIEQQLVDEHRAGHQVDVAASVEDVSLAPSVDREGHVTGNSLRVTDCPQGYDTFEAYFERVQEMETLMSFYYLDEDNSMKVTEICAYKPPNSISSSQSNSQNDLHSPGIRETPSKSSLLNESTSYEQDQMEAASFCRYQNDSFVSTDSERVEFTSSTELQWDNFIEEESQHSDFEDIEIYDVDNNSQEIFPSLSSRGGKCRRSM